MKEEDKYWILLSRYIADDLSLQETDELLEWINDDPERIALLQQTQSAWDQSKNYQKNLSQNFETEAAWIKIKNQLEDENSKKIKKVDFKKSRWLSIAASVIIFCAFSFFFYYIYDQRQMVIVANHEMSKQQILLPDGTKIWLNTNGEIKYPKGLASFDKREVLLSGEAFFDVKHDDKKPFIVRTGETEVQVLGTSFDINEENDEVKVSVITGKVSFKKTGEVHNLFLLPGDEGTYNENGTIAKREFKNKNFLFWQNQTLVFENEKLLNVLQELENCYQVKFKANDKELLEQRITTSFKAASINEVINTLEVLLDLKITLSGGAYIVVK